MANASPGGIRLVHITTVPQTLRFLHGQVQYMKSCGFDVLALSSPGDELDRFARIERIEVRPVAMTRRISPVRDLIAVFKLWYLLAQLRPHIVHAHTPKAGLLGMLAALLARVPVRVYHIRGLPMATAQGPRRWLLLLTERLSCAIAQRVLSVSSSVRDAAIDSRICPPGKIKVLLSGSGNGVDADRRFNRSRLPDTTRLSVRAQLGIPGDALVIGFVGRLVRDKGVEELLSAWSTVAQQFPDALLLVVGPFEAHDPLPPPLGNVLGSHPRIRHVGHTDEMPTLYAAIDLLVLPTYREGFPNVLLEAAAMRLPVVATRVTGCGDAVQDGVTGTLVPARDAIALARAIGAYLRDPPKRRRHGDMGRQRVLRRFGQQPIWHALHGQYEHLLGKHGLPCPASGGHGRRPSKAA